MSAPIVRFAPSPTGRLHIGNMRTALMNWLLAKAQDGTFILRLDDTDTERSREEYAQGIREDLAWFGIVPDREERQSARFAAYDAAAEKLRATGKLYACYETPDEIERRRKRAMARGLPPVYDRAGLKLTDEEKAAFEAEGRRPHWRFLLPNFDTSPFETQRTEVAWDDVILGTQTVDLASMSDPVLVREDGTYLYTLPSVVDDIAFGITHVMRGGDHITNTGAQIALFEALGASAPIFAHHNLLVSADGEGLSKRKGALSVASLREDGLEPMAVASLAVLTGTSGPVTPCATMAELQDAFSPQAVTRSPAKFDAKDLESLNEKIIHAMPFDVAKARLDRLQVHVTPEQWQVLQPNLVRISDVADWMPVFEDSFEGGVVDADDAAFIGEAAASLPDSPWQSTVWQDWTSALKEKTGRKGRALFMPLRKALTGRDHGPDMGDLLPLIGRERTLRRLS